VTLRRVGVALLALWILVLGYLVQPHSRSRLPVRPATPLDVPNRNLPTLGPFAP